jgi:hypothetical protein
VQVIRTTARYAGHIDVLSRPKTYLASSILKDFHKNVNFFALKKSKKLGTFLKGIN